MLTRNAYSKTGLNHAITDRVERFVAPSLWDTRGPGSGCGEEGMPL